jgi:hypothetical protein
MECFNANNKYDSRQGYSGCGRALASSKAAPTHMRGLATTSSTAVHAQNEQQSTKLFKKVLLRYEM